jgi:hypothetical protein
MKNVITRKQLELGVPHQPIREMVQPQEQPCFQAEGIQLVDVPNNEPQQPIMTYLPFH